MQDTDQRLVEQFVQTGDVEAYSEILKLHSGMVYAVCSRILRDQALAEDVCQETFLQLLRKADTVKGSLACWLHTTATWKAIDIIRQDSSRRKREFSHALDRPEDDTTWEEISSYIDQALTELPEIKKRLLIEHFLEGKTKTSLAEEIGVSQATITRKIDSALLHVRKYLERKGIAVGVASLLTFLGSNMVEAAPRHLVEELGKMTILAGAKASIGRKFFTARVLALSMGVLITGAAILFLVSSPPKPPPRSELRSVHFTLQSPHSANEAPSSISKGAYEQWIYFPEGADGPVLMRMQRWSPTMEEKWCSWLQDADANYYYHAGENRIYVANYRLWLGSLRTRTLPTDTPEFVDRINDIDGPIIEVDYIRDPKTGYLQLAVDHRFPEVPEFKTEFKYDTLTEDFFNYNWATDVEIVDRRDAIHRQGWTYFRIEGHIGDETVRGTGRMPLVYREVKENSPWLNLALGEDRRIVDSRDGAARQDSETAIALPPGHFFHGLARPWMGMHTIDIIRRDAIRYGIPFVVKPLTDQKSFRVEVTLMDDHTYTRTRVTYRIDMYEDLIESISFLHNSGSGQIREGQLRFSYFESKPDDDDEFVEPMMQNVVVAHTGESANTLWLLDLARGHFQ